MEVQLYFARGLIEVEATRADAELRFSPDMRVSAVRYYAPGDPVYSIGSTVPWRGFGASVAYRACH
jgi:hypothetical protein